MNRIWNHFIATISVQQNTFENVALKFSDIFFVPQHVKRQRHYLLWWSDAKFSGCLAPEAMCIHVSAHGITRAITHYKCTYRADGTLPWVYVPRFFNSLWPQSIIRAVIKQIDAHHYSVHRIFSSPIAYLVYFVVHKLNLNWSQKKITWKAKKYNPVGNYKKDRNI